MLGGGTDAAPKQTRRAAGGAASAVLRRHLSVLICHAEMAPNRTRRALSGMHDRYRTQARRNTSLVPGLPRCDQSRLAPPGERRACGVRRVLQAVRPVPRRKIARLAGRGPRAAHRELERREGIPAVRPLPQPAPAAVQGAGAEARAAAAEPASGIAGLRKMNAELETPKVSRRMFTQAQPPRRRPGS